MSATPIAAASSKPAATSGSTPTPAKPLLGFRDKIAKGGKFSPDADRYHLYISLACPYACRCLAVMNMKGLSHVIGLSNTHPTWQRTRPGTEDKHTGWFFASPDDPPVATINGYGSFPCDGCTPDAVNGAKYIRDLYDASGAAQGPYSVPVLWDKKLGVIVNNESAEIMRMFDSQFNHLAKNPDLDLYPEDLRAEIDAVSEWVSSSVSNGVYRCGFAQSQAVYEKAFDELFAGLDRCEAILSKQRYIAGPKLTEADIKLFMSLIRFDEAYFVLFKTNKKFIHQYPNLREYVKELYHIPGIQAAVNMDHIKIGYFTTKPELNWYGIIPRGPGPWYAEPHDRDEKFATADA